MSDKKDPYHQKKERYHGKHVDCFLRLECFEYTPEEEYQSHKENEDKCEIIHV